MFLRDITTIVNGPESELISIQGENIRGVLKKYITETESGRRRVKVRTWVFLTLQSKVTDSLTAGDQVSVRDEIYHVTDVESDGFGGAEIYFDKVRATNPTGARNNGVW